MPFYQDDYHLEELTLFHDKGGLPYSYGTHGLLQFGRSSACEVERSDDNIDVLYEHVQYIHEINGGTGQAPMPVDVRCSTALFFEEARGECWADGFN